MSWGNEVSGGQTFLKPQRGLEVFLYYGTTKNRIKRRHFLLDFFLFISGTSISSLVEEEILVLNTEKNAG